MKNMKSLYILLLAQICFQLQCNKTKIQATIGTRFLIICTYKTSQFRFSKKYWCAGDTRASCEILMDTEGFKKAEYRNRAKITDAVSRGLVVVVEDLQLSDTGIYWVGIDKIYSDIMFRIQIEVTKEPVMKPKIWPLGSLKMTCWGQHVAFRCRSEKGTDVQYTWYRVGDPDDIVLHHSTDLHLHCSNITEDRQFFCSAYNDVSSQSSESIALKLIEPGDTGCVYLITSKTLTSYDCIRSTTTSTPSTNEIFWSSAGVSQSTEGRNQTMYVNQTWTESCIPWSWSELPLWYECLRWLLFLAMITILCVVQMCIKSRSRGQSKHHKDF